MKQKIHTIKDVFETTIHDITRIGLGDDTDFIYTVTIPTKELHSPYKAEIDMINIQLLLSENRSVARCRIGDVVCLTVTMEVLIDPPNWDIEVLEKFLTLTPITAKQLNKFDIIDV
tara:strand:- start:298 stop:645 length:348 start_codon:yes stop_codon:yes gene_type:complete